MSSQSDDKSDGINEEIPRRRFLVVAGTFVVGLGIGNCTQTGGAIPKGIDVEFSKDGIPVSIGYILVDTKKCQGCVSCMLACSLVNEGESNLSLARIQVIQNSFEKWPDDVTVEQCRQCVEPACVKACPENALFVDAEFGNVRRIDAEKCIGCGSCFDECPYTPKRTIIAADENFGGEIKARKCDLCATAKFHWDEKGGGPLGKQACAEVCPVGAIRFTNKVPQQAGESGYKINLRDSTWGMLGYPTD